MSKKFLVKATIEYVKDCDGIPTRERQTVDLGWVRCGSSDEAIQSLISFHMQLLFNLPEGNYIKDVKIISTSAEEMEENKS